MLRAATRSAMPFLLLAAAILFLSRLQGGKTSPSGPAPGQSASAAPAGRPAPAFTATTLSGSALNFPGDFAGKLVLLDFWATWCPPCRAEIKHLREAYQRFRDRGFEIVGITLDAVQGIRPDGVRRFLEEQRVTWPQVYSQAEEIARRYGVEGIPAPFLVDGSSGRILAAGDELRGSLLLRTVERHLPGR